MVDPYTERVGGIDSVSWEEFRKIFQNKLYPHVFYEAKSNEFMSLVQGNMSVAEYEKKFTELAKYVLAFVVIGRSSASVLKMA